MTPAQKIANREAVRRYARRHPERRKQWVEDNRETVLDYQNEWNQARRQKAVDHLGGKCARCGFNDQRALQIDHVNGLVGQIREGRTVTWRRVLSGSYNGVYQLLCANCNWIKRAERGEHGTRSRRPRKESVS